MQVRWCPWVQGDTDPDVLGGMEYPELQIFNSMMVALNIMAGI
jgi:hypothetical protein